LRHEKERVIRRPVNMDKVNEILAVFNALPDRDPRPPDAIVDNLYGWLEQDQPK
jgi:hypothetical protein